MRRATTKEVRNDLNERETTSLEGGKENIKWLQKVQHTQEENEDPGGSKGMTMEVPPDGGWGWVVVIAGGLGLSIVGGYNKSISLVYQQMLMVYGKSDAATASTVSLNGTIRMIASPLAGVLVNKTSNKTVGVLAGITCSLSLIATAFMPSLGWVYLTYGIVFGTGIAMYVIAELSMVNLYFSKNRGKANALESCFMGIGALYMTQLLSYLFDEYGYRGTLLIIGAIMLHIVAAVGVFRPLRTHKTQTEMKSFSSEKIDAQLENGGASGYSEETTEDRVIDDEHAVKTSDTKNILSKICAAVATCGRTLGCGAFTNYGFSVCMILMASFSLVNSLHMSLMAGMALEKGYTKQQVTLCMSLSFALEIVFRLGSGLVFDHQFVSKRKLPALTMVSFVLGITVLCQPIVPWLVPSMVCFMLQNGFLGAFHAQATTVMSDTVPRSTLISSLGLMRLIQGIGNLCGPFFGGLMRDLTGSYALGYVIAGVQISFISVCAFTITLIRNRLKSKRGNKPRNSEEL